MEINRRDISWLKRDKKHASFKELKRDVARLEKGEPLAYVIGWAPFLNCRIDLSKKPLIPRPETEFWTEKAIQDIKKAVVMTGHNRPMRVLDVFAGSGCIGIAVLAKVPNARADFADIDKNALAQIRKNLKLNRISPRRYSVKHSDILKNVGMFKYDYILANPPYIPSGRKKELSDSVVKYEPGAALWAGRDGLGVIRKFVREAKKHLAPGGRVYMEFDSAQKPEITALARKSGLKAVFHRDQFGRWRYVIIEA